jgi:hypothetical protein
MMVAMAATIGTSAVLCRIFILAGTTYEGDSAGTRTADDLLVSQSEIAGHSEAQEIAWREKREREREREGDVQPMKYRS